MDYTLDIIILKEEIGQFYILLVREDENIKERYGIVAQEEIKARLSNPKDVLLFKRQEAEFASGGVWL